MEHHSGKAKLIHRLIDNKASIVDILLGVPFGLQKLLQSSGWPNFKRGRGLSQNLYDSIFCLYFLRVRVEDTASDVWVMNPQITGD